MWELKWVLLLLSGPWARVQFLGLWVPSSTWTLKVHLSWWPFVKVVLVPLHLGPIKFSLLSPSPTHISALSSPLCLKHKEILEVPGEAGSATHTVMFSPNIFSLWKPSICPHGIRILRANARKTFFSALILSPLSLEAMNREPELSYLNRGQITRCLIFHNYDTATDFETSCLE